MAGKGPADIAITDITAGADVGTGTFYNHFSSREEILQVAAEESMETVGQALDASVSGLDAPAEVWSASLRYLVRYALTEQVWGWFFVNVGAAHPALDSTFGPRAARDLQRGVDEGRFRVDDPDFAAACTFGALFAAVHKGLTTRDPANLDVKFARAMLRMVGISTDEAARIAELPLPELAFPDPDFIGTA